MFTHIHTKSQSAHRLYSSQQQLSRASLRAFSLACCQTASDWLTKPVVVRLFERASDHSTRRFILLPTPLRSYQRMWCITPESIRVQISHHQRRKRICSSSIASTPFSLYAREEMSVIYLTKTNRLPVFHAKPDGCNGNHHPGRYRVLLSCSAHSPSAL